KDTENGDNTITADELGISYRTGYVFDGWYTSDSGTISLDREGTFDVSGKTRVAYFDQATEKMVFDSSFKSQHSSEATAVGGFYYDESSQNVSERGLHVSEDWNDDPDNGGKRLTLYAHWTKVSTAQYKVVIWKQKDTDEAGILEREKTYDYDRVYLSNPVSTSEGIETSNELSNFTGTENYENSVSGINLANLGNTYADDFKGFVYARADWTDGNTIEPDGSTIINLYYDRITYNLKFFFARRQNNGNFYVPSLSGSNLNPPALNQPQTWQNYLTNSGNLAWQDSRTTDITQICKYPYSSATNGNYTYYYYIITANYGTQIGDKWPEYSQFADANHRVNNYFLVSWWMMRGAENYYVEGGTVRDTVKGKVLTMDEQILGNLSDPDGNFLFTRFGTSTNNWYYRIWQEELEGADYGDKQKVTKDDGITYVNTETIEVKSGQTSATGQSAPAFLGFTNKDSYTQFTNQNNSYYMDYYYTRDVNDFIFKDNWPDGSNRPGLTLNVKFDASLSDFGFEKNGTITNWYYGVADDFNTVDNTLVAPDHYKFGGWYVDSTCNVPFDFNSKMPAANKAVYAKWIEVQYSAEIDPNGGTIDHITPSSNPTQSGSGSAIIDGQSYTYSYSFSNFSYGRSEYNGSYSTYVNLSYGEALGQYDLSRSYVPITAEEAQERISAGKPVFYYVNTRRTNSGVFLDNCGSTGLPSALRNAIFLKADDNDAELKAYFLFYVNSIHFTLLWGGDRYADAIDFMESDSNSDGKPDAYTRINYNTQALFNAWLGDINTSGSNANRLYNEWLSTY
ncbi:MAG: InlB B-repeat-containing protein, partial [Oscillospiraceae bacterium]|nr:InlB B-repeat-containing protein [Oscillospiraceae bacterium]